VPARSLTCAEAARRLWDYVDARLPKTPLAEVEAHLAICGTCAGHIAFAHVMRRALAETSVLTAPGERHTALRARVLTAMNETRR
jgi:anti-sigma factor RsiW